MMVIVCHKMHGGTSLIDVQGWTVLGQYICPWMDGSRTTHGAVTEEPLPKKSFQ